MDLSFNMWWAHDWFSRKSDLLFVVNAVPVMLFVFWGQLSVSVVEKASIRGKIKFVWLGQSDYNKFMGHQIKP